MWRTGAKIGLNHLIDKAFMCATAPPRQGTCHTTHPGRAWRTRPCAGNPAHAHSWHQLPRLAPHKVVIVNHTTHTAVTTHSWHHPRTDMRRSYVERVRGATRREERGEREEGRERRDRGERREERGERREERGERRGERRGGRRGERREERGEWCAMAVSDFIGGKCGVRQRWVGV